VTATRFATSSAPRWFEPVLTTMDVTLLVQKLRNGGSWQG
jgi:hypothetical protein